MKALTVPAIFKAVDKMTRPVNKMSRSVEASMERLDRKMRRLSKSAFALSRKTALMGTAIIAPMLLMANEAVKFEDRMADVAKVANISLGSLEFQKVSDQAIELSKFLAIDAIEAAGLMQNLAQGGVALDQLNRVSITAGKIGVAFGISGDMAGEMFIKTKNALGGTIEQTEKLMDTINFLGNTTAAASDQILTFMASGGSGVARATDASAESISVMGAEFIAMGKSAEESATIMQRFTKQVLMDKKLRATFDSEGGGTAGMMEVLRKGAELSGKAQDAYFQKFGAYGISIQLLAKNFENLEKNMASATNEQNIANSVQKEFENRTNTTAFKLNQAKANLKSLAITLGNSLIPIINDLVKSISPVLDSVSKWIKENQSVVSSIVSLALKVGALMFAISAVSAVVGIFAKVISLAKYGAAAYNVVMGIAAALNGSLTVSVALSSSALKAYNVTTKIVTAATKLWGLAMKSALGPIGWVIIGVGALSAGVYALSGAWRSETKEQKLNNEVKKRALKNSIDQRVEVNLLFKTLRKAEEGSKLYNNTLKELERIQPGIVDKFNLQKKSIDNLNLAYNEMVNNIIKVAEAEVRAEMIKEKIKKSMEIQENGLGLMKIIFEGGLLGLFYQDQIAQGEIDRLNKEAEILSGQQVQADTGVGTGALSPSATQSIVSMRQLTELKETITVDFKNVPAGVQVSSSNGDSSLSLPNVGNTRGE